MTEQVGCVWEVEKNVPWGTDVSGGRQEMGTLTPVHEPRCYCSLVDTGVF